MSLYAESRAGLVSPQAARRLSLMVFKGRTTDQFPITSIVQQYQNAEVLVNQNVSIESFTVTPGVNFVEAPVVSISNWASTSISLTPNGCTIDGSFVSINIPAGGELVLIALVTGEFLTQGSLAGGISSVVWGDISGDWRSQIDIATAIDGKAGTDGASFTGLTRFLGGVRGPTGDPVSGPLTMAQHNGGEYSTAGNCTVPDEAGFKVLLFVTGSHTIGLAGGTQEGFVINDVVLISIPETGVVLRYKMKRVESDFLYNQWRAFSSAAFLSFDDRVASLAPTSYWKLQGNGTATTGGPVITLNGSPQTGVPTIVRHDDIAGGAPSNGTCIAMPGTSETHADMLQDFRFHVPSGTFVIFHQHDTGSLVGGKKSILLSRDEFGSVGGFGLEILSGGFHRLYFQRPGGAPLMDRVAATGVIVENQAYMTLAKWGFTDTLFVEDSFSGAAAPLVGGGAHVGELGATWTKQTGDTGVASVANGTADGDAGGDGISAYFASGIPPSTDYAVEATIVADGGEASVCVRMATDSTFYRLGFDPTLGTDGSWTIKRKLGGGSTDILAQSDLIGVPRVANRRYYLRLEATGTNPVILKGWINGHATFPSVTDASGSRITAIGKAGMRFSNGATSDRISHLRAGVVQGSGWAVATYSAEATLLVRTTSTITEAPTQESDIRIGAYHTADVNSNHNGPLARVIFFDRRIANTEEPIIALPKTIVHS